MQKKVTCSKECLANASPIEFLLFQTNLHLGMVSLENMKHNTNTHKT
jgi:hypothetical protein